VVRYASRPSLGHGARNRQRNWDDSEPDFLAQQRKIWVEKGGEIDALSPAVKDEMMAKLSAVGDDIVKTKPQLKPLWGLLRAAAKRSL
jgi:hypothetical protein